MTRIIIAALTGALAACAHQDATVTTTSANIPASPVWSPSPQADSSQMPFDLPKTLIRTSREVDRTADARIAAAVLGAIVADESLPIAARHVDVTTVDGVVTLRGRVETAQQRDELIRVARATPNVRRVESQIRIAP